VKTLTPIGLAKQAQRFADNLDHATYERNGVQTNIAMHSVVVTGDTVKINLYFNNDITGLLRNFKLVDKAGDIVAHALRDIQKPLNKGLYVGFRYKVAELEADD